MRIRTNARKMLYKNKKRMHVKMSAIRIAIRNNEDAISMLRTAEVALSMVSQANQIPQMVSKLLQS